jgi:hypothetical protein
MNTSIPADRACSTHGPLELVVLGTGLAVIARKAWHLHSAFRATPANFPIPKAPSTDPTPGDSLRNGYRKSKRAQR